ncbi:MAG: hypothetical protein K2J60_12175 [Acetatifactor sp.]|nr:hypothetical protein [Acetatifactor sp.]
MPVMDEFREERAAMKNGTLKQKIAYFFDYYKWYVVFGIAAVIFAASFIYQLVTNKETAFCAMLLNAASRSYSEGTENTGAFAAYAGIDTDKYDIVYDTSVQFGAETGSDYYAAQQILVHVSAADVDVMISDPSFLLQYAYIGDFYDLRDFLNAEQMDKYKDFFYYIDGAVMEEIEAARKDYDHEYEPVYGDPIHPENMQDPIPVGLFLQEGCPLLQDYLFSGDNPALSVLINTKHPETASKFIDFLMD